MRLRARAAQRHADYFLADGVSALVIAASFVSCWNFGEFLHAFDKHAPVRAVALGRQGFGDRVSSGDTFFKG